MLPKYQLDRLDMNDLDAIELELNPSHDLVRALVRLIKDQRNEMSDMECEFLSLLSTLSPDEAKSDAG